MHGSLVLVLVMLWVLAGASLPGLLHADVYVQRPCSVSIPRGGVQAEA